MMAKKAGWVITITRPELTDIERERRLAELKEATANLVKASIRAHRGDIHE